MRSIASPSKSSANRGSGNGAASPVAQEAVGPQVWSLRPGCWAVDDVLGAVGQETPRHVRDHVVDHPQAGLAAGFIVARRRGPSVPARRAGRRPRRDRLREALAAPAPSFEAAAARPSSPSWAEKSSQSRSIGGRPSARSSGSSSRSSTTRRSFASDDSRAPWRGGRARPHSGGGQTCVIGSSVRGVAALEQREQVARVVAAVGSSSCGCSPVRGPALRVGRRDVVALRYQVGARRGGRSSGRAWRRAARRRRSAWSAGSSSKHHDDGGSASSPRAGARRRRRVAGREHQVATGETTRNSAARRTGRGEDATRTSAARRSARTARAAPAPSSSATGNSTAASASRSLSERQHERRHQQRDQDARTRPAPARAAEPRPATRQHRAPPAAAPACSRTRRRGCRRRCCCARRRTPALLPSRSSSGCANASAHSAAEVARPISSWRQRAVRAQRLALEARPRRPADVLGRAQGSRTAAS